MSIKLFGKAVVKTAKTMANSFLHAIKKEMGKVATATQVAFPVIMVGVGCSVKEAVVVSVGVNLAVSFIKNLSRELNGCIESGMPIPRKCFTSSNSDGFLAFNSVSDRLEALQYLNELEGYLKLKGVKLENDNSTM